MALKVSHEFGRCYRHRSRWAVVKLQNQPMCLKCFEAGMAGLGSALKGFKDAIGAGSPGTVTVSVVKDGG